METRVKEVHELIIVRRLFFDGVAEIREGLADLPAGLAEPLLDRALGALKRTLTFHLLVAGEDPDGLFDLPLGIFHFSVNFLLFHRIFLSAKTCEPSDAQAFTRSFPSFSTDIEHEPCRPNHRAGWAETTAEGTFRNRRRGTDFNGCNEGREGKSDEGDRAAAADRLRDR
jgi:hypothetical protein